MCFKLIPVSHPCQYLTLVATSYTWAQESKHSIRYLDCPARFLKPTRGKHWRDMCASFPLSPDSCRLLGITPQNPCLETGTCSPPFTDLRCFDACLWHAVSIEGDGAAHFYTVTWLEHLSIERDFCLSVFLGLMLPLFPENYYVPQI